MNPDFHFTDLLLAAMLAILGYFMRDRDKRLQKIGERLDDHIQNCAHMTPRERELQEELMTERFENIDERFNILHQEIRLMGGK